MEKKAEMFAEIAKLIGGLVISIGVGAVVKNLIQMTTPENVKKITKICIGVGSFFVAGVAAKAATDKFDGTIDSIMDCISTLLDKNDDTHKQEGLKVIEAK